MNHSSTQVPFVLAAIIAVIIHSVMAEPKNEMLSTMTNESQALKLHALVPAPMLVEIEQ